MFRKKSKENDLNKKEVDQHPYRFCHLYISETYNQILFVPFAKTNSAISTIYAELDSIIIDKWPCDFGHLEQNITATLNKFSNLTEYKFGTGRRIITVKPTRNNPLKVILSGFILKLIDQGLTVHVKRSV